MKLIHQVMALLESGIEVHGLDGTIDRFVSPRFLRDIDDKTIVYSDGCGEVVITVEDKNFMADRRERSAGHG